MTDATAVVLNVGVWGGWSLLVGYAGHRWPLAAFDRERWWSRPLWFEHDRRFYARTLRIHAWKDLLPEFGALFPGGFPKRTVARSQAHVQRFLRETRRAEAVHWVVFWAWPVFGLWNPWWAVAIMLAYALAANLPCVFVQRYNRARLLRTDGRFARAAASRRHERTARVPDRRSAGCRVRPPAAVP